jgi:hypothetical protein
MKKILLPVLMLSIVFSCSKSEDKQKKMIEEVMAVHDEVMPKMDEMMTLKSQLDSIAKISPDSLKAKTLYIALDSADVKMMDWMESYNPDEVKGKSEEEVLKYYEDKKASIIKVKDLTNTSIEEAKVFLKK